MSTYSQHPQDWHTRPVADDHELAREIEYHHSPVHDHEHERPEPHGLSSHVTQRDDVR